MKLIIILTFILINISSFACPFTAFEMTYQDAIVAKAIGNTLIDPEDYGLRQIEVLDFFKNKFSKTGELKQMYKSEDSSSYFLVMQVEAFEEPTIRWYIYREAGMFEGFVGEYVVYTNHR